MSGDTPDRSPEEKPRTPGTGAGGASGPTGASSASSAGQAAFGPQEIQRRDIADGETGGAVAGRARQGMFGIHGSGDTSAECADSRETALRQVGKP